MTNNQKHKKNSRKSFNRIKKKHTLWIYGKHASIAAIKNPRREVLRILVTKNIANDIARSVSCDVNCEITNHNYIDSVLHVGAAHQGIACEVTQLPELSIDDVADSNVIAILDQITDPQNIGAILRSAAAFGIGAIILPKNNSPEETGSMAKTASGALEVVPLITVTNFASTIDYLKERGFWCLGLDGYADITIKDAPSYDKTLIILGAEGKGMRRLTKEKCDVLVSLPISKTIESLNVSNAAAIAFYEICTQF